MSRFDCATWRPIAANTGGSLAPIGCLMHQQVGNGSLYGYFSNPAVEVSAHFWVAKDGRVEQYVDTNTVAWHAKHLNGTYCGTECEGYPQEALTDAQLDGFAAIMAEGAARHGWPNWYAQSAVMLNGAQTVTSSVATHGTGEYVAPGGTSGMELNAGDGVSLGGIVGSTYVTAVAGVYYTWVSMRLLEPD